MMLLFLLVLLLACCCYRKSNHQPLLPVVVSNKLYWVPGIATMLHTKTKNDTALDYVGGKPTSSKSATNNTYNVMHEQVGYSVLTVRIPYNQINTLLREVLFSINMREASKLGKYMMHNSAIPI